MSNLAQRRTMTRRFSVAFGFYEPASERLGAAVAHSWGPLVQLVRLGQTWPGVPRNIREAIVAIGLSAARSPASATA